MSVLQFSKFSSWQLARGENHFAFKLGQALKRVWLPISTLVRRQWRLFRQGWDMS